MQKNRVLNKTLLLRLLPVAILVLGFLLFLSLGGYRYVNLATLQQYQDQLQHLVAESPLLARVCFGLAYFLLAVCLVPGVISVFSFLAGFLFGVWEGILVMLCAVPLASSCVYWAVRFGCRDLMKLSEPRDWAAKLAGNSLARLLRSWLAKQLAEWAPKLQTSFERNIWVWLFLLRVLPIVPLVIGDTLPALLRAPYWKFGLACCLGLLPIAAFYTNLGKGMEDILAAAELPSLVELMTEPQLIIPILGLLLLLLLGSAVYNKIKAAA